MLTVRPRPFAILVSIIGLLLGSEREADAASFTVLGNLGSSGISSSFAAGISGDGTTVVGRALTDHESRSQEAFIWTRESGMRGLGDVAGGGFARTANAISADGSTVVGVASTDRLLGSQAFVWNATDGARVIPSGNFQVRPVSANGVSADGSVVVGDAYDFVGGRIQNRLGFVWNTRGQLRDVGELPGTNSGTRARGVSGDGTVVVGYGNPNEVPGQTEQGYFWTSETGIQAIGPPVKSEARAISTDGSTIVGFYNAPDLSGGGFVAEAFRWTEEDGIQLLRAIPADGLSSAAAVSADGSVIGGSLRRSGPSGNSGPAEAFIWNAEQGMQPLETIMTSLGIDLGDWSLSSVTGISADGLTIIGTAMNKTGVREAYIATIPEPSTAVLLSLGLLGLGSSRKRV